MTSQSFLERVAPLIKQPLPTDLETLLRGGVEINGQRVKMFISDGERNYFQEKRPGEPGQTWELNGHDPVLFHARSPYQTILVVDTIEEGRLMVIDGQTMLSDNSERCYHEWMVHPAMLLHPNPKTVFIAGGGDGGIVREVLKHPEVETAIQCEIDKLVTPVTIRFFPQIAADISIPNPKVELVFDDASKYLAQEQTPLFNVVFYDLCDPESGPSQNVFQDKIFSLTYDHLTSDGILVMQSESVRRNRKWRTRTMAQLREHFPTVASYFLEMPTYPGCLWSATLASKKPLDVYDLKNPIPPGLQEFTPQRHKASFQYLNNE